MDLRRIALANAILWTLWLVILVTIVAAYLYNLFYRRALTEDAKWLDELPAERERIAKFGSNQPAVGGQPTPPSLKDVEENLDLDWETEQ